MLPLVIGACTRHTVATHTTMAGGGSTAGITQHGFVNGELVLHFTAEGERAVTPTMSGTQGWLRFNIPSLDQLNAKYHATALAPIQGEKGAFRLKIAPDANVFRAAEEYGHDPMIARAEPNYMYKLDRPPEEPSAVRTELPPGAQPDTVRIRR
ncbi:MAG TPA: hypothetical protein VGK30_11215 [Candidatus Binatia bacterium]